MQTLWLLLVYGFAAFGLFVALAVIAGLLELAWERRRDAPHLRQHKENERHFRDKYTPAASRPTRSAGP